MPTRNVNLTKHHDKFVADAVEAGRYGNASEAVRAGLRLLEQQEREDEARIAWLRGVTQDAFAALDRGEGLALKTSGDIGAFMDEILSETLTHRIT